MDGLLGACGWYGKAFENSENVSPLLFGDEDDLIKVNPAKLPLRLVRHYPTLPRLGILQKMFRRSLPVLSTNQQTARLRLIEHGHVLSATMVNDAHPIIDHFRRIDETRLLGLMDLRYFEQPYFFFCKRSWSQRADKDRSLVEGLFKLRLILMPPTRIEFLRDGLENHDFIGSDGIALRPKPLAWRVSRRFVPKVISQKHLFGGKSLQRECDSLLVSQEQIDFYDMHPFCPSARHSIRKADKGPIRTMFLNSHPKLPPPAAKRGLLFNTFNCPQSNGNLIINENLNPVDTTGHRLSSHRQIIRLEGHRYPGLRKLAVLNISAMTERCIHSRQPRAAYNLWLCFAPPSSSDSHSVQKRGNTFRPFTSTFNSAPAVAGTLALPAG